MQNLTDKAPTLSQKLGILETWFMSRQGAHNNSITVRQAGEVIFEKGLANDIDSAIKIIVSQLRLDKEVSSSQPLKQDEFNRIFMLPLFKGCFLDMLIEVEMLATNKDLPLSLKLANY